MEYKSMKLAKTLLLVSLVFVVSSLLAVAVFPDDHFVYLPFAARMPTPTPTITPTPTNTLVPPTDTPTPELAVRALVSKVDGDFVPDLATSWEVSEDGTIWVFRLVRDVQMEGGSNFNATAVQETLKDWPPVGLGYVSSEPVDDYTVVIRLVLPTFDLLNELSKVGFITRK